MTRIAVIDFKTTGMSPAYGDRLKLQKTWRLDEVLLCQYA